MPEDDDYDLKNCFHEFYFNYLLKIVEQFELHSMRSTSVFLLLELLYEDNILCEVLAISLEQFQFQQGSSDLVSDGSQLVSNSSTSKGKYFTKFVLELSINYHY